MPSGGYRANAGRPKGSKTTVNTLRPSTRHKITERLTEKCADKDTSPMEVMLDAMIFFDRKAKVAIAKLERMKEDSAEWKKQYLHARSRIVDSVEVAKDLAPFVHAKLQAVTLKGDAKNPLEIALGLRSAEELKQLVRGRSKSSTTKESK